MKFYKSETYRPRLQEIGREKIAKKNKADDLENPRTKLVIADLEDDKLVGQRNWT